MCLNSFFRKSLVVLCIFLFPLEVWSAIPTKAVEVRLEPEVTVGGGAVLLGDVATIYAKSGKNFQALSQLVLAEFPGDRNVLTLPQGYLASRIKEALPAGTDFKLQSPETVTFRLQALGISSQELAAEVIRQGRLDGKIPAWAKVQVEPVSGFDQLKLWKLADTQIQPAAEMDQWKGEMSFKVSPTGGTGQKVAWVKVRVRWFADAWVARRSIGILGSLQKADFVKQKVEVTGLSDDPLLASEDLGALLGTARARHFIRSGAPLVAGDLERAPDAKLGQTLKVVFISESGIRVTTQGAILGNGEIGSNVRAKLYSSRKVVTGKLVSSGVMEVSL